MAGIKRHVETAEDRNGKRTKIKQGSAPVKKSKPAVSVKKTSSKKDIRPGKSDKKVSKKKIQEVSEDEDEDEDEFDIDDVSDSGDDDLDGLDDLPEDDVDMEDVSDEAEEDVSGNEKKTAKSDKKTGAEDGKQQQGVNEAKSESLVL